MIETTSKEVDTSREGAVAFVELHDSRMEALILQSDQTCVIRFRHLPVYHARAVDDFAIWSYRASLELRGVDRLVCEGGAPGSDYVSDAFAFNGVLSVQWKALLDRSPVTRIEMIFGSGMRIDIQCHEAFLTLDEPVKHVEDWHGPL